MVEPDIAEAEIIIESNEKPWWLDVLLTKKELRIKITFFTFHYRTMAEARRIERLMAPRCPFKFMKSGLER